MVNWQTGGIQVDQWVIIIIAGQLFHSEFHCAKVIECLRTDSPRSSTNSCRIFSQQRQHTEKSIRRSELNQQCKTGLVIKFIQRHSTSPSWCYTHTSVCSAEARTLLTHKIHFKNMKSGGLNQVSFSVVISNVQCHFFFFFFKFLLHLGYFSPNCMDNMQRGKGKQIRFDYETEIPPQRTLPTHTPNITALHVLPASSMTTAHTRAG